MSNDILNIGPQKVDATAGLTANSGIHNDVQDLISEHAASYPEGLVENLILPADAFRSEAATEKHDEIEEAAKQEGVLDEDDKLLAVGVRGSRPKDRFLSLVFEAPSGRSGRAVLPYDAVAGLDDRAAELESKARDDAGNAQTVIVQSQSDDRIKELEAAVADLKSLLEAQARDGAPAEPEAAAPVEGDGSDDDQPDVEPYEGYDKETVKEIVAVIEAEGTDPELIADILTYEQKHEDRKGVLEAIEKKAKAEAAAAQ